MEGNVLKSSATRVLALIPAFNESARIGSVILGVKPYLPILVVDDGSRDDTSEVARRNGAEVLRQEPNQGKGAALLAGFRYALEKGYDAVITLDADGQHDPAEIPLFLKDFFDNGSDLIIGKRDFHQMPFPRNLSNTFGTWLFSKAMKQYVSDNQSGYRLHSKRLIIAALESSEHGFEFEVEIILRCVLNNYKISWVPIRTIYAGEKSHIKPLQHAWHFFRITARTGRIIRKQKKPST